MVEHASRVILYFTMYTVAMLQSRSPIGLRITKNYRTLCSVVSKIVVPRPFVQTRQGGVRADIIGVYVESFTLFRNVGLTSFRVYLV